MKNLRALEAKPQAGSLTWTQFRLRGKLHWQHDLSRAVEVGNSLWSGNALQESKIASFSFGKGNLGVFWLCQRSGCPAAVLRLALFGERPSGRAKGLWSMRQAAVLRRKTCQRGRAPQCTIAFIPAERWSAKSGLAECALWMTAFYDVLSNRRLQARKTRAWPWRESVHGLGGRCYKASFGAEWDLTDCVWGRCVQGDFLRRCLPAARALCRRGAALLALVGQGRFEGGARLVLEFVMGEAGVAEQDSRYPAFRRAGTAKHASPSIPFGQVSQPAGPRRTPPAPAQGTCPLRIPLAAARLPHVATKAGRLLRVSRPASYSFSHFNQKRNKARPPPCSWGGRASLIRGSSGRAHCAQGAELMVSEMRFSMASMP